MKKTMYGMLLLVLGICTAGGCGGISGKSGPQLSGGTEETEVITEEMGLAAREASEEMFESETVLPPQETVESETVPSSRETEQPEETEVSTEISEVPEEENGRLELYAERKTISIPPGVLMASVSPEELLEGNVALYDRFRIDGWVFEWFMTCKYKDGDSYLTDGVLVISREGNAEAVQIVNGLYVSDQVPMENKFEYTDVNFDGVPDLLLCTGYHGNQGLVRYQCLLQTEKGFVEEESFEEIANPAVDAENKLILSQWRNNVVSHSWAEYAYQDGRFVLSRELMEDVADDTDFDSEEYIWVWTVNGEEIARSDELTDEEIEDLIYNANSDWGISCDRWRTLYNQGLTTDYSIYGGP